MADDTLTLDAQLCFALYAASNAITRRYRPLLAALGLTYTQYLVLLALWEQGPASVRALASVLQIESATLTPTLKRMEAAGLVTRERNRADERELSVRATAKANRLRRRLASIQHDVAGSTGLGPTNFAALRAQLRDLAATVTQHATK